MHNEDRLFAFLADVRNGYGCQPISKPRGLPVDVSCCVYEEYKEWGGDAHSASYLTLKELRDFDYETLFAKGFQSYRIELGENYFRNLDYLEDLEDPDDVDDVRVVFFFDN